MISVVCFKVGSGSCVQNQMLGDKDGNRETRGEAEIEDRMEARPRHEPRMESGG